MTLPLQTVIGCPADYVPAGDTLCHTFGVSGIWQPMLNIEWKDVKLANRHSTKILMLATIFRLTWDQRMQLCSLLRKPFGCLLLFPHGLQTFYFSLRVGTTQGEERLHTHSVSSPLSSTESTCLVLTPESRQSCVLIHVPKFSLLLLSRYLSGLAFCFPGFALRDSRFPRGSFSGFVFFTSLCLSKKICLSSDSRDFVNIIASALYCISVTSCYLVFVSRVF